MISVTSEILNVAGGQGNILLALFLWKSGDSFDKAKILSVIGRPTRASKNPNLVLFEVSFHPSW